MKLLLAMIVVAAVLLTWGTAEAVTVKKIGTDTLTTVDSLFGWLGDNTSHFIITIEDNYRLYYNRSDADSMKMTRCHWSDVQIETLWVFLDLSNSGSDNFTVTLAVYDTTTGGVNANLLATSEQRTIVSSSSDGWYGFDMPTPLAVVGGRSYCLGGWSNLTASACGMQRLTGGPTGAHQQGAATYGSWPSTLNLASTLAYYVAIAAQVQAVPTGPDKAKKWFPIGDDE